MWLGGGALGAGGEGGGGGRVGGETGGRPEEGAQHKVSISQTFKNFIMSNCRFSVFLIDSHFFAVNRMPSNRAFDGSLIFCYISADNANVDAVDGMFFDLLCNVYVTFIIFAYNQGTGGIHINTMNNSRTYLSVDAA